MASGVISRKILSQPNANGIAVIFSNDYHSATSGESSLKELSGTAEDGKKMEHCFESLNFATYYNHNVSRKGLLDVVSFIANFKRYPPSYKRIVVVFSGHGTSGQQLFTNDSNTVNVEEIIAPFDPFRAPAIGNIPKLFFIDACRGDTANPGSMVPKGSKVLDTLNVPQKGNFLVAYSTLPEYKSYEVSKKGGVWITTLAEKLRSKSKSVCDILTEVNKALVAKYQEQIYKGFVQQPEFVSRLNDVVNLRAEAQEARGETVTESDSDVASDEGGSKAHAVKSTTKTEPIKEPPVAKVKKVKSTRNSSPKKPAGASSAATTGAGKSSTPPCPKNTKITPAKTAQSRPQSDPTVRKHKPQPPPPTQPVRTISAEHSGMGGNARQRLETFCLNENKPKPKYQVERVTSSKYKATVYVAKAFGRLTGDTKSTKIDAELDAATKYLEKLTLGN